MVEKAYNIVKSFCKKPVIYFCSSILAKTDLSYFTRTNIIYNIFIFSIFCQKNLYTTSNRQPNISYDHIFLRPNNLDLFLPPKIGKAR